MGLSKFFWVLLVFCLILAPASVAVTLPENYPDIVARTAQKDKAAIVLINSMVSGTAVFPSFELVQGNDLLGSWHGALEDFTFNADGTFVNDSATEGATYNGTYSTDGDELTLNYESNSTPVVGTYWIDGDILTLSFPSLEIIDGGYTWVSSEETGVVENAQNLEFVIEEDSAATVLTEELETGAGGTGFIVTPDGYIITNAHVVLTGEDQTQMLVDALYNEYAQSIYDEAVKYYNISDQDKDAIVNILLWKFVAYFQEYGQIQDITTNYYVLNGVAVPGQSLEVKSWLATVKKEGTVIEKIGDETSWGRDIAILKVDKTNLPTVRLGDSGKMQIGDKIFIIGYPSIQLEEFFNPASALEATVTQGIISAKRTLKSGLEVFQTDAAINHGNSGGPAYNDKGEVIGIATFGAGTETGVEAVKFMMEINLAKEFMNEINVHNTSGLLDESYGNALEAFRNRDCPTAISGMQAVLAIYPGHPYAQDYINECQRAIQAGEVSGPNNWGVIILILAVVAAIVFFMRKKIISLMPAQKTMPQQKTTVRQPKSAKHFCPECGAKTTAEEKFCPDCGKKL